MWHRTTDARDYYIIDSTSCLDVAGCLLSMHQSCIVSLKTKSLKFVLSPLTQTNRHSLQHPSTVCSVFLHQSLRPTWLLLCNRYLTVFVRPIADAAAKKQCQGASAVSVSALQLVLGAWHHPMTFLANYQPTSDTLIHVAPSSVLHFQKDNFGLHHLLFYVVYMFQKSLNSSVTSKQRKAVSLNVAHVVQQNCQVNSGFTDRSCVSCSISCCQSFFTCSASLIVLFNSLTNLLRITFCARHTDCVTCTASAATVFIRPSSLCNTLHTA